MPVTQIGGQTGKSNPNAKDWQITVTIESGTTSEAFSLPDGDIHARIGATGTADRTLTLERLDTAGTGWLATELTHTTVTTEAATSEWTSDQFFGYRALFGRRNNLRLSLSASDSITVIFDCQKDD